jgi:predicted sugar kinase
MADPQQQPDYFLPGEQFRIRDEWRRPAAPVHRRARVWAPARLHFNVIDFFQMRPMIAGAGGFGFSTTGAWSEVEVTVGDGGGGAMPATARHLCRLFGEMVGYAGDDVSVRVPTRIQHVHGGFGSNVTFNTAVVSALNALFGTPFSVPEVWDVLTQNFVENAGGDDVHVYWGMDTGVGEACLQYGGLVWVDQWARYVGSADTAGLWVVTAGGDMARLASDRVKAFGQGGAHGVGDMDERESVVTLCFDYQREYHDRVLHFLEHRMKPAILRNDARAFLAQGWELNEIGTYRVMEELWRKDVLRGVMRVARETGALYAMMSSAGPSIFAIAEGQDGAERVREALEREFAEFFTGFAVGQAGVRMRIDLVE